MSGWDGNGWTPHAAAEREPEQRPGLLPRDQGQMYWMLRRAGFVVATSLGLGCLAALAYVIWWMP